MWMNSTLLILDPLRRRPEFSPKTFRMGFPLDNIKSGRIFPRYFGFPLPLSFHNCSTPYSSSLFPHSDRCPKSGNLLTKSCFFFGNNVSYFPLDIFYHGYLSFIFIKQHKRYSILFIPEQETIINPSRMKMFNPIF
jgi:hypothetical protein